uniref:Uncharacterized protein n=1 Tax=Romanomermis culicivorax TaxID=13658 RepID=A0A915JC20_ROMCU
MMGVKNILLAAEQPKSSTKNFGGSGSSAHVSTVLPALGGGKIAKPAAITVPTATETKTAPMLLLPTSMIYSYALRPELLYKGCGNTDEKTKRRRMVDQIFRCQFHECIDQWQFGVIGAGFIVSIFKTHIAIYERIREKLRLRLSIPAGWRYSQFIAPLLGVGDIFKDLAYKIRDSGKTAYLNENSVEEFSYESKKYFWQFFKLH